MTQFYIGSKMVEAWPQQKVIPGADDGESRTLEGYAVKYPDGYVSWSPKDVFESAYLSMGMLPTLQSSTDEYTRPIDDTAHFTVNSNRVTQEMVSAFVAHLVDVKMGEKTTVVTATLVNGFEITESSSCVDPAMYDHKIGVQLCEAKIMQKIWLLLGFLLQTAKCGVKAVENIQPPVASPAVAAEPGQ